MIRFTLLHPRMTHDALGIVPEFFSEHDPAPAREQIEKNYQHGGGWNPFPGFTMTDVGLRYPGDPIMQVLAEANLRDETIRFYDHSWLAIIQPDGSYEIARVD